MRGFKPHAVQQFARNQAGNAAIKKPARVGYKNGGPVRGPGTGTSDDVPDEVPEGTYIMPSDSTKAFGTKALGEMGQKGVPVNLSNGEYKMPPEQVHAIGVQALDQMKNATHTPAPQDPAKGLKPELFFAGGGLVEQPPVAPALVPGESPTAASAPPPAVTPTPQAAPNDWAANNLQRNTETTASSIMDSPERTAARAALGATATAAPTSAEPAPEFTPPARRPVPQLLDLTKRSGIPGFAVGGVVTQEEAQRRVQAQAKPNYFPGNSPDAGANIYGGVGPANGLGSSGKLVQGLEGVKDNVPPAPQSPQAMGSRKAAGASPDTLGEVAPVISPTPQSAATPTMPQAPAGTSGLNAPWYSREYVTAANMSDKSGLQLEADRAKQGAALNIAADDPLQRALRTGTASTPQAAATNYNFPSTAGAGRGSVNPPLVNPTAPRTADALPNSTAPEDAPPNNPNNITREGSSYSGGPNISGDITVNGKEPGGGFMVAPGQAYPSPGLMSQTAAPQMTSAPQVRNSTNDFASRKALENARTAASSITANGGRFDKNGKKGSPQQAEYAAMLANDLALQGAQPGMDAAAMRENAATGRAAMQESGQNSRSDARNALDGRRITAEEGRYAIDAKAKGFDIKQAERMQGMQDKLQAAIESGDEKQAGLLERQIRGFSGKGAEDKFGFHFSPNVKNNDGSTTEGAMWRTNPRTGAAERVDGGGAQTQALPMPKSQAELKDGQTYETARGPARWDAKSKNFATL